MNDLRKAFAGICRSADGTGWKCPACTTSMSALVFRSAGAGPFTVQRQDSDRPSSSNRMLSCGNRQPAILRSSRCRCDSCREHQICPHDRNWKSATIPNRVGSQDPVQVRVLLRVPVFEIRARGEIRHHFLPLTKSSRGGAGRAYHLDNH